MSLPPTFVKEFHNENCVRKMEYCLLGKTNLQTSKISIGGATFASFYGCYNEEEAIETLKESIRRGINYIDTAPYYGQGKSEAIIGKALNQIPREAYYIASKVGRYNVPGTYDQFDYSAKRTLESVEKSLQLLGLNYIDIIQIHDIEFEEDLTPVLNECLPALENLRKGGKIGFIGVTGYPLEKLKEAIVKAPGRFDVVLGYHSKTRSVDSTHERSFWFI